MTKSADQYDEIANAYEDFGELPIRAYAEIGTFLGVLGDVRSLNVLDLACGTGLYTRMIRDGGARRIVGVDASAGMVAKARAVEPPHRGIEYAMHDVARMPNIGTFDTVTAAFLLNYSQDRHQLMAMCERIATHLRPGGRFVGELPNSHFDRHRPYDTRYGITVDWPRQMHDGETYTFRLHSNGRAIPIECRYWTLETYQAALEEAGLREVRIQPWLPTPLAVEKFGPKFWEAWTTNPFCVVVSAVKP
ncbi:class I SAM-dependent DNA methyltransferase [Kribbella sp. NBC_00359]|uniref:class I SAM-dependent DNA methyltransferase n=1 Tax=Kribbella sp. NBC_00359 TaxID=2975966 RepID=UPI002E20C814